MPEPLWRIRQRKGMSVNQLSARSGVPAISITEYESGQAIRSADLPRLAKALYVEEWEIEIQGKPLPKPVAERTPSSVRTPPARPKRAERRADKVPRPPAPARPSQIEHLLTLAGHQFNQNRASLEKELGKPLEQLTRREASDLLKHYQQLLAQSRSSGSPDEPGTKRKRAYLPEGIDEFELQYLTSQKEAETVLRFTLFSGEQVSGRIIGFSPYSITISDEESGEDVTLQKLAIAYYTARNTDQSTTGRDGDEK